MLEQSYLRLVEGPNVPPAQPPNSLSDRIRQILESATPAEPAPHAIEQRLEAIEKQLICVLAAVQQQGQGTA